MTPGEAHTCVLPRITTPSPCFRNSPTVDAVFPSLRSTLAAHTGAHDDEQPALSSLPLSATSPPPSADRPT
jgi:hypothetical protein